MTEDQNTPVRLTSEAAGCIVDGHIGWRGIGQVIELAVDAGMPIDEADALALVRWLIGDPDAEGDLDHEIVCDLSDQAETWLNEHLAPEGYSFGWHDGEYFLWADTDWEEVGS